MPERRSLEVIWPDGRRSRVQSGQDWLQAAAEAGYAIPTGCLGGSCGACELEVNGQLVRACIATVPASPSGRLVLEIAVDPHW